MRKIRITKKDGSVKVAEINRKQNILGAMNSYSLKTGKSVDFKKALLYSLSTVPLCISESDGTPQHTAKSKLKDILLKDLQDHTNE